MEQQFSLCWREFQGNLTSGCSHLLASGEFADVTLATEGHLLKAHKLVLSICSPFFQRMFHANPCQHPIVVLKDVSYNAMKDLLQFMYNGEVSIRQEDLTTLISTAETLEVKGLTSKSKKQENNNDISSSDSTPPKKTLLLNENSKDYSYDEKANDENVHSVCSERANPSERLFSPLNKLAPLKRKNEAFPNTTVPDRITNNVQPEKRVKLREKQILNRHKISINHKVFLNKSMNELKRCSSFDDSRESDQRTPPLEHANGIAKSDTRKNSVSSTDSVPAPEPRTETEDLESNPDSNSVAEPKHETVENESNNVSDDPKGKSVINDSDNDILNLENLMPKIEKESRGVLPMRYHYIYSRKGHKQLVHMNFIYTKHSTTNGKTSWRCVQYFSLNRCPATAETFGSIIYAINHLHNHEDCPDKIASNSVYEMEDAKAC